MNRAALTAFVALLLSTTASAEPPSQAVVARVDGIEITIGELTDEIDARYARNRQEALEVILIERLMPNAARLAGVNWSSAEIIAALPEYMRDPESYRRSFEPMLAMARASLRVAAGEELDVVYEEDVKGLDVSLHEFEERARAFGDDVERIQQFISTDHSKKIRDRKIREVRTAVLRAGIRDVLLAEKTESISFDSLATELWSKTLDTTKIEILDDAYHLPSWQGVIK